MHLLELPLTNRTFNSSYVYLYPFFKTYFYYIIYYNLCEIYAHTIVKQPIYQVIENQDKMSILFNQMEVIRLIKYREQ